MGERGCGMDCAGSDWGLAVFCQHTNEFWPLGEGGVLSTGHCLQVVKEDSISWSSLIQEYSFRVNVTADTPDYSFTVNITADAPKYKCTVNITADTPKCNFTASVI